MLLELLETRAMVKASMKKYADDKVNYFFFFMNIHQLKWGMVMIDIITITGSTKTWFKITS